MALLRFLGIAVPALLSAAGTVVVALVGAGQLDANLGFDVAVCWLALGTVFRPLARDIGAARELKVERNVRGPLVVAFRRLHEATAIPYEDLGVHAYFVGGWWPFRRLVCVGRLRLEARDASGVRWKKRKGVIGQVWDSGQFGYAVVEGASEGAFNLHGRDLRRLANYGVIAAAPILDRGKVVGCVAVDAPTSYESHLIGDENRPKVKRELGDLAAGLRNL